MFHEGAFSLSRFQKHPVNAEFLELVIIRRSANHSWRPSLKATPKKRKNLAPVMLGFGAQTFKTFALANPMCACSALTVVRTRTGQITPSGVKLSCNLIEFKTQMLCLGVPPTNQTVTSQQPFRIPEYLSQGGG